MLPTDCHPRVAHGQLPHLAGGPAALIPPIAAAFAQGKICRFKPLPSAAAAVLVLEMKRLFKQPVVLITESAALMDEMRRNLEAFTDEAEKMVFDYPPLENIAGEKQYAPDQITAGERLRTLAHIACGPFLINTCVQALMQKIVSPAVLKKHSLHLSTGEEYDPARLTAWLERSGYAFVPAVQDRRQAARRGGLTDVWPPSEPNPVRIEFDGLTIESIRHFDPVDQRSIAKKEDVILPPASEMAIISNSLQKSFSVVQNPPRPDREAHRDTPPKEGNLRSLRTESHAPLLAQAPPEATPRRVLDGGPAALNSLAAHLPPETIFFWTEKYQPAFEKGGRQYGGIAYHADLHEKSATGGRADRSKTTLSFHELTEIISGKNSRQCLSVVDCSPWLAAAKSAGLSGHLATHEQSPVSFSPDLSLIDLGFRPVQDVSLAASGQGFSPQSFLTPDLAHENRRRLLAYLEEKARLGMKVHFFFGAQGALDHFRNTVAAGQNLFHLHLGAVSDGFLHAELQLAVISESGLLFRTKTMRRHAEIKAQRLADRRSMAGETACPPAGGITDRLNIEPGDLVVHVNHGIGKYLGLYEIIFNGKLQEVFAVEYAGRARLYVPVSQAHLLSRYLTAGGQKAKIHRLAGSQWLREKQSAQNAIYDIAATLLENQALRETFAGFAFPADTAWQRDFEAAFPYEETGDQERAVAEVKSDMESPVPMDRLICGDAGYGKTEVAMRAAFKAVMAGKQVALLVPTTVLALQHYEVFQQRMEDYPVRIELLCRFRSVAEQRRIVEDLQKGVVDIVIGTHRLLQSDLGFKDLGLIIIDEEQRFGVAHKERLKQLKKLADVLTLTATPIPRTLYLSLTGARKISMVQTPPKMRLPIETIVAKNDETIVRPAILRELNRGGQVFYLYNRVATIDKVFGWLKRIVPEARLAVAHGRLSARELAEKMHAFAQGMFDVLLCTTIVESGVDLPNANTILIDRADRFGIAELYQLRGRVGRADRKAYAYLLTPVHGYLLDVSRRRLQAIMEHSSLGSGFRLAMLDLEIRGAGNLLGAEQSGHIAAIGFDLYCQLLRRAIESLKSGGQMEKNAVTAETVDVEVNLDFIDFAAGNIDSASAAFLPIAYIEDEQTRVSIYRRIASAVTIAEIESLREEFADRFGPLPAPFERFLKIAALHVRAARKNISSIEVKEGRIMFSRCGEYLQIKNRFPRLRASDPDGKLEEIARWLDKIPPPRNHLNK